MRQLDLFSALQASGDGINAEFKSTRGVLPGRIGNRFSPLQKGRQGTIVLGLAEKIASLIGKGVVVAAQQRTVQGAS